MGNFVFLTADISGQNHLKYQNKSKISDVELHTNLKDRPTLKKNSISCLSVQASRSMLKSMKSGKKSFPRQQRMLRQFNTCYNRILLF